MSAEIVKLTPGEAHELTEQIRAGLIATAETCELIVRAYRERVWLALDYDSWDAWVHGEQLDTVIADQRDVLALHAEGMSLRAIAAVTGTSKDTVGRQLSQAETVDETVGRDGKTRPSRQPLPHEIEHRRDIVEGLWREGRGRYVIARALDPPVSESTVVHDLKARHVDRSAPRRMPSGLLGRIPWRDVGIADSAVDDEDRAARVEEMARRQRAAGMALAERHRRDVDSRLLDITGWLVRARRDLRSALVVDVVELPNEHRELVAAEIEAVRELLASIGDRFVNLVQLDWDAEQRRLLEDDS
jgi:hypothetical protein